MSCRPKRADVCLCMRRVSLKRDFRICSKSYENNAFLLYKTRFMLDELGNLQSEGHGIANFATMLSIGLGQEQQFTLILQTKKLCNVTNA